MKKSKAKSTAIKKKKSKKIKTKVKKKTAIKTNAKPKLKAKSKLKTKPAKKAKSKRTPLSSKKPKAAKAKAVITFTDKQKTQFLIILEKIINLHKSDKDGLKSLTQVERILNRYNQNFTDAHEKFDAIVKYGMSEDPSIVRKHVFVPVIGKDKKINDIYRLLAKIGKGKIQYSDAKTNIEKIYQDTLKMR